MDEIKHPAKVDYKAGFDEAMTQLNAEIKENAILTAERDALKVKLAEYEGENKRWHSFEIVQAIVKERDLLSKQLEMAREAMLDVDNLYPNTALANALAALAQPDNLYKDVSDKETQ